MREGPLTWTVEPGQPDGTTILRLTGPWTLENTVELTRELPSVRPPALILEMSGVPYIDSVGMGVLVQEHVSAQNAGRIFHLAGVTDHVMALLYLINVHTVLKMYPTLPEAEAAVLRRKRR